MRETLMLLTLAWAGTARAEDGVQLSPLEGFQGTYRRSIAMSASSPAVGAAAAGADKVSLITGVLSDALNGNGAKSLQAQAATQRPMELASGRAMGQLRVAQSVSVTAASKPKAEAQSTGAHRAFFGEVADPPVLGHSGDGRVVRDMGLPAGAFDTPAVTVPPVPEHKDSTPGQGLAAAAMGLLLGASSLVTLEGVLAKMGVIEFPMGMLAMAMSVAAIGMAITVIVLGMILAFQYDQMWQGLIFMIGGAIVAVSAALALIPTMEVDPIVMILGGIVGIGAAIAGMLMAQKKS